MNSQNKYIKIIYVFIMLAYLLNMSGARSSLLAQIITPLLPFKCAGHGCACDLAGKELPGCGCFGYSETNENDTQACSMEKSCCSAADSPVKNPPSKTLENTLDQVGCDGKTASQYETLDRHCNFELKIKTLITSKSIEPGVITLLRTAQLHSWRIDKVPITLLS